jgi:hypothetical protein
LSASRHDSFKPRQSESGHGNEEKNFTNSNCSAANTVTISPIRGKEKVCRCKGKQCKVNMAALMYLLGFNYTDRSLLATKLKGAGAFGDDTF